MRLFQCQSCTQLIYFENRHCVRCDHRLGYIAPDFNMTALEPAGGLAWTPVGVPGGSTGTAYRFCANAGLDACNWLLPEGSPEAYCTACRHNRTVPNLLEDANIVSWRKMEAAKHRLIYTLMRLGLPLPNRADDPERGLVFDFLADPASPDAPQVMTGHDEGLVTLALIEADDAERERRRSAMGEPYRTLLGHFRHEVGHYYWDRLVRDQGHLEECRAVFGDDRADYTAALQRHYEHGAPPDWQDHFVSTYATTHAWEDFAETWAHYLHILDCLETASAFGLQVHPEVKGEVDLQAELKVDPYAAEDFTRLVDVWLPLTYAMNGMNRSMGLGDLYPFVLSAPVIRKLSFIHDLVHRPRHAVGAQATA